jgi:uncharacterized protein (TIGR00730 family)
MVRDTQAPARSNGTTQLEELVSELGRRQSTSRTKADPKRRQRVEPLPVEFPKPSADDPQAPERVRALLASHAYIRADSDPTFLHRDEMRHARLELEYLKPEIALHERGIESTIVLFGGTRIVEPTAARRRVAELATELSRHPEDTELQRRLDTAERVLAKSRFYDVAREFARLVSEHCKKAKPAEFVIMTGGGPGIMEAGNRGAFDAGRHTVGLNIHLPLEQYPNPYITPDLCFQFRYFALRKLHFVKRAKALVAFPGGYGTFDELFETLCLVQTRKIDPIPIVLVGEAFWRRAFDAQFLVDEGVIAPEDMELFFFAETAQEIWDIILSWYEEPEHQWDEGGRPDV